MSDIQQAKEWAKIVGKVEDLMPEPRAAVKVIQSLPDEWVDAKKLREAINEHLSSYPHGSIGHTVAEDLACKLQTLFPAPSLPTLAEMTPEEREACRWMQADLNVLGDTYRVVILNFVNEWADCMRADGARATQKLEDVTPLPDLPKLEWPSLSVSGESEAVSVETQESEDLPHPEDVPPSEPWIVEHYGHRWVGTREESCDFICSWALARFDGADYNVARDEDITLVSRLVPEATA